MFYDVGHEWEQQPFVKECGLKIIAFL